MRKSVFIFLFSLWICIGFCQNVIKPIVYKNINGKIIQEIDFKKLVEVKKTLIYTIEKDSVIIKKIFQYDNRGFFEPEQVDLIKTVINNISQTKVEKTDILVINFFIFPSKPPFGNCIDHYTSDRIYKSFFTKKKNSTIKQFFITEATFEYIKEGVFRDKQGLIEELCFSDAMECGNYIIIYPDNSFIRKYCEYRQSEILDYLKNK